MSRLREGCTLGRWLYAKSARETLLVESQPDVFFVPPYVGPSGWVGMILVPPNWTFAEELLTDAYRLNASKRQIVLLEELDA